MQSKGSQFEGFGRMAPRRVTHHASGAAPEWGLPATDTYSYIKEDPNAYGGWSTHQTLEVEHQPAQAVYAYPRTGWKGNDEGAAVGEPQESMSDDWHAELGGRALRDLKREGPEGQQKLFGMGYEPSSAQVSYMGGTKEGRGMALTMLGIAQNAAQRRGQNLEAPQNLSEHSSRLVGHLQRMGAVSREGFDYEGGSDNPVVSNELDFNVPRSYYAEGGERQLPHAEVMAGRATARNVIRQAKGPVRSRQASFEQQSLF